MTLRESNILFLPSKVMILGWGMGMTHYWWTVFGRALADSFDAIGQTKTTFIFALLVIAATATWTVLSERAEGVGWRVFLKEHMHREVMKAAVVTFIAWLPFFWWFSWKAPYSIQQETEARVSHADNEVSHTHGLLTTCQNELVPAKTKIDLLDTQNRSQQNIVSGQQATLTAQQQTLNSQIATVNTCVVTLAKNSTIEQRIDWLVSNDDPRGPAPRNDLLVIVTNKPLNPVTIDIRCDSVIIAADMTPANGSGFGGDVSVSKDGHDIHAVMTFPPLTPNNPLLIKMRHGESELKPCQGNIK